MPDKLCDEIIYPFPNELQVITPHSLYSMWSFIDDEMKVK